MAAHLPLVCLLSLSIPGTAISLGSAPRPAETPSPIRALMITGGGWHDYAGQKTILSEGIAARVNVNWTIVHEGADGGTAERSGHRISVQQEEGWADGFDVVVYNICFSNVRDVEFIERIARVHESGMPAVVLHCTMHSYRDANTDAWRSLLGVETRRHESHRPFTVENIAPAHPVMKPFPKTWRTPQGELYIIEQVHESVVPLAQAYGVETERHHLTIWTNQYGRGRIFGTTIGHHNETMAAPEYLDVVSRGLLWATGHLQDDGNPASGYGPAADQEERRKRLVMVAGRASHGRGAHEHNAGVRLLRDCLRNVPAIEVIAHLNGWPEDPHAFDGADGILLYMDGGGNHPAIQEDRLEKLRQLMNAGVGLAAFHYATEVPAERGGAEFLDWIGGYYETHYSVNPIWTADVTPLPDHPINRGIEPFAVRDEWYFNIRFREDMSGVTSILQASPTAETRGGPYVNPRGPYPHIVEQSGRMETLAWAVEREDGGRGFGFTGGHFHENWGDPNFRKTALNALVWITGAEVPEGGVACEISSADLERNLD